MYSILTLQFAGAVVLLAILIPAVYRFERALRDRSRSMRTAALAGFVGLAVVGGLVVRAIVAAGFGAPKSVTDFADEVNAAVPANEPVYFVGIVEDQAARHIRRALRQVQSMPTQGGYAIVQQKDSDALICERNGRGLVMAEPYDPPGRQDEESREGDRRMLVRVPPVETAGGEAAGRERPVGKDPSEK